MRTPILRLLCAAICALLIAAAAPDATWGEERTKRWPQVPTLKELGYGIVSNSPYGSAGPRGIDPKVVTILHDAIKRAIEDPAYVRTIERLDQEPWYRSSEQYTRYARELFPTQKALMQSLGLKR